MSSKRILPCLLSIALTMGAMALLIMVLGTGASQAAYATQLSAPQQDNPTVVATVTVGSHPIGVAVNPTTNRIYVANYSSDNVSVIDGSNNTVALTVSAGTSPCCVGVNSITNRIYVVNDSSGNVSVVDGANNTVIATVTVGTRPDGVDVNSTTNRIYVANHTSGNVSVIDGANNTVAATVTVGIQPYGVGVNPTTNRVYVANHTSNNISVIDGSTNMVAATVSVGSGPYGVGVNPTTNRIYVTNYNSGNVSVIDGANNTVVATVTVGIRPSGVSVNSATNRVYVANNGNGNVSVIDGANNTVAATVAVGSGPYSDGVNVNPATGRVYIANYFSNNVSVIQDLVLPQLALSKTVAPNTGVPHHGVVTYTLVLNNSSTVSDTNVLFTDTLPPGATFGQWLSAPAGVVQVGNSLSWVGTVTDSTSTTFAFTAMHTGNYGDVISNAAYFSGTSQAGNSAAGFTVEPGYTVTVNRGGTGAGIVSSVPAGINCGATCSAMFAANSIVTLMATPLISSTLVGWSGDRITTTSQVTFTMNANKSVTATFALKTFIITPTTSANGSITPSTPQMVNYGASRTFTITANAGYHIFDVGVDGVSQGPIDSYAFNNITASHTISASFANSNYTLTVNYAGNSIGSVLADPPGLSYTAGALVTLTAVPSPTSRFTGWSGDVITTTTPLVVTMDSDKTIIATFVTYRVYLPVVLK